MQSPIHAEYEQLGYVSGHNARFGGLAVAEALARLSGDVRDRNIGGRALVTLTGMGRAGGIWVRHRDDETPVEGDDERSSGALDPADAEVPLAGGHGGSGDDDEPRTGGNPEGDDHENEDDGHAERAFGASITKADAIRAKLEALALSRQEIAQFLAEHDNDLDDVTYTAALRHMTRQGLEIQRLKLSGEQWARAEQLPAEGRAEHAEAADTVGVEPEDARNVLAGIAMGIEDYVFESGFPIGPRLTALLLGSTRERDIDAVIEQFRNRSATLDEEMRTLGEAGKLPPTDADVTSIHGRNVVRQYHKDERARIDRLVDIANELTRLAMFIHGLNNWRMQREAEEFHNE